MGVTSRQDHIDTNQIVTNRRRHQSESDGAIHRSVLAIGSVAVLAIATAGTATAQSPAEFYKGRNLTLLGVAPRRRWLRHLCALLWPSSLAPDAGQSQRRRAEHAGRCRRGDDEPLFPRRPRTASVIGLGAGPLATAPIMGSAGARYDARQISWIGSMNAEVATAIAWHTHPVKTAKDLETTELVIAAGGATDISAISPIAHQPSARPQDQDGDRSTRAARARFWPWSAARSAASAAITTAR